MAFSSFDENKKNEITSFSESISSKLSADVCGRLSLFLTVAEIAALSVISKRENEEMKKAIYWKGRLVETGCNKALSETIDDEGAIEDVLTKEDFNKYVLGKPADYKVGEKNSSVIPDAQKVILSQKFLNDCRQGRVTLSTESKNNFKRILEQLLAQLDS